MMKYSVYVFLLSLLLAGARLSVAASYTFTTIDVPGSGTTIASGINDAGQIVGSFTDARGQHGFLFSGGLFTTIDVPGSGTTIASGINDAGQIVGSFTDPLAHKEDGFLFSGRGFTTIDVPGSIYTAVTGFNNVGEIVGVFQKTGDSEFTRHGFLFSGGSFTTIDVPGNDVTEPTGINDAGQIVGSFQPNLMSGVSHGFLFSGGRFTLIDAPGTNHTDVYGINDAGQIVGDIAGGVHGFLFSGGSFTTIDVSGINGGSLRGINNVGEIVGLFSDGARLHGFLATPAPPTVSLSATSLVFTSQLVGMASSPQGVTLGNTGTATLTITSIAASRDFAQTNTCGNSLNAGASCIITVTFTPTAPGNRTGTLSITDNAAGSPHMVNLSGTGTTIMPTTPPPSQGGGGCAIGGPVNVGTATAHVLILLMPALVIGCLRLRRKRKLG